MVQGIGDRDSISSGRRRGNGDAGCRCAARTPQIGKRGTTTANRDTQDHRLPNANGRGRSSNAGKVQGRRQDVRAFELVVLTAQCDAVDLIEADVVRPTADARSTEPDAPTAN